MAHLALGAAILATVMVLSTVVTFGVGTTVSGGAATPPLVGESTSTGSTPGLPPTESGATPVSTPLPSFCTSLKSVSNDPGYASFVRHVDSLAHGAVSDGLPSEDLHLPYAGPIADQTVNGTVMAGGQLSAECEPDQSTASQAVPTGVAYDGQTDIHGVRNRTLDSNSVAGILTVNSPPRNFYPGSGTPTVWGAQENLVLPNVTIYGAECPSSPCAANGSGNYAFWVQNVVSYDSNNDSLYMVDDTWNFTSYTSEMYSSSLVRWSPNGGNYTGTWVAFSPYYHVPTPFTVIVYTNTSVNSAGDQVLWYNYSIQTPTHFIGHGNYDYLVFRSQPTSGPRVAVRPPDFEASALTTHVVTEGYEFDAFIGADDGSNQLILDAHATMKVEYCVRSPYCTPAKFSYANVPAAVNYGSQTGEEAVGVAVNYVGTTAYLSAGPVITHGLWNYTGAAGVAPGNTRVNNAIHVSGDPEGPLAVQPYVFVFFKNQAFRSEGYQWAPDVPAWNLMPGTYHYEVMLADYAVETGTIKVAASPTVLSVTLPYTPAMGVYTPLWAFGNGQLAGISQSGSGTISSQFLPFNNPTTGYSGTSPGRLNSLFFSANDYFFPSFPGVLFAGTSAYVDLDNPPTFSVGEHYGTHFYLGLEFYRTSHLTLSNDRDVQGWPAWSEIAFYISVPASQNPAPQAEVFLWDSTHDLIMSNEFVGTSFLSGATPPDALVMYGGTDNVVWGNTFTDARGTALNARGQFAGIGLGESGDLLYNNNFSVDNPVVYLPYNWPNVADCLPQSLGGCAHNASLNPWYYNDAANVVGNAWNVTPQPAGKVSRTVNGFPLSGSILGPEIPTQGGNYFWNFGKSANSFSTIPYVSRFYYSDWSNIFPLGCGSIQAPGAPCGTPPPLVGAYEDGMTAGGDYAPYGPTVIFSERGLPAGTTWYVTIHGARLVSNSRTITVEVSYGSHPWAASAPGWASQPAHGQVFANGAVVVQLEFHRVASSSASALPESDASHGLLGMHGEGTIPRRPATGNS